MFIQVKALISKFETEVIVRIDSINAVVVPVENAKSVHLYVNNISTPLELQVDPLIFKKFLSEVSGHIQGVWYLQEWLDNFQPVDMSIKV